jgi:phage replication initiation protein
MIPASSRVIKSTIYGFKNGEGAALAALAATGGDPSPGGYPTVNPALSEAACTPINNMGENWHDDSEEAGQLDLVMTDSGKTKTVMVRKPAKDGICIVDWINFTVLEDTWFRTARERLVADEQIMCEASRYLEKIFGFGITEKRPNGMNFYRDSWVLGDGMGFVCFGGQRQTMLVTLTGQGCQAAVSGWEKRLYEFLTTVAIRPSISRVDLAHDDIDGAYLSVDWAEAQWHVRGFSQSAGGRPPSIERIGNWHRPSGKGRTLTIGLRTSGKFCRFYEKGRKEGDRDSEWCRVEVEFKNSDRVIPFDVLTTPSDFFTAAYPCFSQFVDVATPQRMAVKQKTAQVVIEACVEVTKHQFGKYLRVFRELYGDKDALDMVCNPNKNAWPRRMKPLTADCTTGPTPIHKLEAPTVLGFLDFIKAPVFGLNAANMYAEPHHLSMES